MPDDFQRTFVITLLGVVLVVFIWVWAVTPIFAHGVWPPINLVETNGGRKAPETERDVCVTVRADGVAFVDERAASQATVENALRAANAEAQILVRVDRAAPFGAVRDVVIAAQRAGRQQLIFLARRHDRGRSTI